MFWNKNSLANTLKRSKKNILGEPPRDLKEFELGGELGKGEMAAIRAATEKSSGAKVAIKSISKGALQSQEEIEEVRSEVAILKKLRGHASVISLCCAFEDKKDVHLVTDLCSGGDLLDKISEVGSYSEETAAKLMKEVLSAVAHCHANGVAHRGVELENFLFATRAKDAPLKIIDFGVATTVDGGEMLTDTVGTPMYMAPEVLRGSYGKECDVWSCGVILYILLSGDPPFTGETQKQTLSRVLAAKPDLSSGPWAKVSAPAKDLIRRMLTPERSKRISAAEALKHEWFTGGAAAAGSTLGDNVVGRLKGFSANNKMKKLALKVIACSLSRKEIDAMKKMFKEMDKDRSGTITFAELRAGMKKLGANMAEDQMKQLMAAADADNSGIIDYTEFLAATMQMNNAAKEEHIRTAFTHFDKDGSGTITKQELRMALANEDMLEPGEVERVIAEVDKDGDGLIDYEEFASMMRQKDQAEEDDGATKIKTRTRAVY